MNMNVVFFLISISITGLCIELNLPLSREFEYLFDTDEIHNDYPFAEVEFGVTCYDRFYEAKGDDYIKRVLYKGYELFHDKTHRDPDFKRIVTFSEVGGRVYISVYQQGDIHAYEGAYYVANGHVYDLLRIKQLIQGEEGLICGKTPGRFVSKMFRALPPMTSSEDEPSTSQGATAAPLTSSVLVKRKLIELDIDNIFERRLIGRYGMYSVRKKERSKRSKRRAEKKLFRYQTDSDSD